MARINQSIERRRGARRRLRLHAARVMDVEGRFLVDGAVGEASPDGARLRIRAPTSLPDALILFDETARRVADARVVWRDGLQVGLELGAWRELDDLPATLRVRLVAAYYATD